MPSVIGDILVSYDYLRVVVIISRDENFLIHLRKTIEGGDFAKRLITMPSYHHPSTLVEYWTGVMRGEGGFWATVDVLAEGNI